ncbi:MAG: hypothetical protein JRI33_07170 [Deltaproteobacteria bacterium]|nr:hypothetical protein [Deltaproteobacteria bacterium]
MKIKRHPEKVRLLIRTLMESDFYMGTQYSLHPLERLALVKRLLENRLETEVPREKAN